MIEPVKIGPCELYCGDALATLRVLPSESVHCCVTSPPYWGLRDYGVEGQLGLESTPEEYVSRMVEVFGEVRRVLRDDGTLWLNLGDSYAASSSSNGGYSERSTLQGFSNPETKGRVANESGARVRLEHGLKSKDLVGIPWRVAFALQADGWYLRADIIWAKPNPMPESVTDRPTKAHEYIFLLSKSERYFYDHEAIKEKAIYFGLANQTESGFKDAVRTFNGKHSDKQRGHGRRHAGFNERWDSMPRAEQCGGMRNKRSVWTVATKPYPEAHFATFPPNLIEPCILAGCPEGGTVLDPFGGSGTTAQVATLNGRESILIELNPKYCELATERIAKAVEDMKFFGREMESVG